MLQIKGVSIKDVDISTVSTARRFTFIEFLKDGYTGDARSYIVRASPMMVKGIDGTYQSDILLMRKALKGFLVFLNADKKYGYPVNLYIFFNDGRIYNTYLNVDHEVSIELI